MQRSHARPRRLTCPPAWAELVDGVASPELCIAECRSAARSRSRSHRPRSAVARFRTLLYSARCLSLVIPDEAKLRETADSFEDWGDGTIAGHCGRGEIGNRAGFRCPCSKELEGSNPSARTRVYAGQRLYPSCRDSAVKSSSALGRIPAVKGHRNRVEVGVEQVAVDPQRHAGIFVPGHPRQGQHIHTSTDMLSCVLRQRIAG
jgi:hypothetical protein